MKRSNWWPVYEPVVAEPGWWDDTQPFLAQLTDRLTEHLDLFAGAVADVISTRMGKV